MKVEREETREPETGDRHERPAFLAEASRLLAQSLDYQTTLETVARLAMPELGAWCIVDMLGEDGEMERIAIIHPDPAKQALARQLETDFPPDKEDIVGMPRAMATRRPELMPDVTDTMLNAAARSPRHLELLRELGMGSYMVLPLVARDHLLGCITFVSASERRRYDADDLAFAEDLVNRAALAIDNARLYRVAERARGVAEEASRAKGDFLATMSHELRTPLNAILGYLDLIELGLSGPVTEMQRTQLARIRACGSHLTDLVGQVLDLAHIEAARMPLDPEPGHLAVAVEGALAIVRPAAGQRGVRIGTHCAHGADVCFVADHGRVRQVLVHLLSNAIKFTPAGARVEVSCGTTTASAAPLALPDLAKGERWAFVQVRDAGGGIAPEDAERVFGAFVQLDQSRTRVKGGSGLGLTLSRRLARLMGGEVTLDSAIGRGSVFTLWLPAAQPTGRSADDNAVALTAAPHANAAAGALGHVILERLEEILHRYVTRVRADEPAPQVLVMSDLEILDHVGSLLTDAAQTLSASADAPGQPNALTRDGAEIQRVIAEFHGAQRRRLGWDEKAVRADFAIIRAVSRESLAPHTTDAALEVLDRLLLHAEHESVRGYRLAATETATV